MAWRRESIVSDGSIRFGRQTWPVGEAFAGECDSQSALVGTSTLPSTGHRVDGPAPHRHQGTCAGDGRDGGARAGADREPVARPLVDLPGGPAVRGTWS